MKIRDAKKEDLSNNLLDLYIQGFRYHYNARPDVFGNKTDEQLENDLLNELNKLNFLILEDSTIKGYIAYHIKDKHDRILWIDQLVIDEKYRKQGYGKELVNKLKEIAKNKKCKKVELNCWSFNQDAKKMYMHIGFVEQKTTLEIDI